MDRDLLLQHVAKLPTDQRAQFLDEHCADSTVRDWIERQLASDTTVQLVQDSVRRDLDTTATGAANDTTDREDSGVEGDKPDLAPGSRVGPYRLVEVLGEGGMGTVFLAEQIDHIERRVALKVIKSEIVSQDVLIRFAAERQAMAKMSHPNIARILDVGQTDTGHPFFAMEFVQGDPLTEFCKNEDLNLESRLELFCNVCRGVQHAHQKGVVHRDLKPSNVLVTEVDGTPVAKVIDFGLAKALEETERARDGLNRTRAGQILGTLRYMSPEQASLGGQDVDTRTDIYSLGVMLYELVTGETPLDGFDTESASILEILEYIRDVDAIRPSTRIDSRIKSKEKTSIEERTLAEKQLRRTLISDLDWIVLKALAKNQNDRYASISELVTDVQRVLSNEPISARPPTWKYRFNKFVAKHRVAVVAASLVTLSLLIGVVGTTTGWLRALEAEEDATNRFEEAETARKLAHAAQLDAEKARTAEAARAESEIAERRKAESRLRTIERGNQLLGGIFADLDIRQVEESEEPLHAILASRLLAAAEELDHVVSDDPIVHAELRSQLGESLLSLGYPLEANTLLAQALDTFDELFGPQEPLVLVAKSRLAEGMRAAGDYDESLRLSESLIEPIKRAFVKMTRAHWLS